MDKRLKKLRKLVLEEHENFKKTGVPRCPVCKKQMQNAYDTKLKRISPYLWKTTCEHSKGVVLSVG